MDVLIYLFIFLVCLVGYFIFLHKLSNPKKDDVLALFEMPSIFLICIISLIIGLVATNKAFDVLIYNYPIVIFSIIFILAFFILKKKPKKKKKN